MGDQRWMALKAFAAAQSGLVTREQAVTAGYSEPAFDRLVRSRPLPQLHRGLYQLGPPQKDELRDLRAALLLGGPAAVISHRAAARVHRLWGIDGCPVEFTVPTRVSTELPAINIHRGEIPPVDRALVRGIPVTTVARTLFDLAPLVEPVNLAAMLESVRRWHPTAMEELAARLEAERLGPPLRRTIRTLLADGEARPRPFDSVFEVQFWHRWPFTGLPMPTPQHPVRDHHGQMFIDFAWPAQKVALETQGFEVRKEKDLWDGNTDRKARLIALGWTVIEVGYTMFRDKFFESACSAVSGALERATVALTG